jgi:hypothetical protein
VRHSDTQSTQQFLLSSLLFAKILWSVVPETDRSKDVSIAAIWYNVL